MWRTVEPYSYPAAPQIPLRMFCSGSWKANGKAGTSRTGEQAVLVSVSLLSGHHAGGLISILFCIFFSNQSNRKAFGGSSAQTHTWGGGGSCGHLRSHQPAQPFVQDPAMPPLPPPNTLAQLEEACRRLEEVSTKATKQRRGEASENSLNLLVTTSWLTLQSHLQAFTVRSAAREEPRRACPGRGRRPVISSPLRPCGPPHRQPEPPIRRVRCL